MKIESLCKPCKEIDRAMFLCYKDESQLPVQDYCINALIQFSSNTSTCNPVLVKLKDIKVEPIQQNQWIIYSKFENLLTKSCNSEETREKIQGTYILTLENSCEVNIKGLVLKNHRTLGEPVIYSRTPYIEMPQMSKQNPLPEKRKINLDDINLTKLQQIVNGIEESEPNVVKSERDSFINVRDISLGTLILYIIVISSCIILVYKFKHLLPFLRSHQNENHPSDDFDLNGGGVINPTPRLRNVINVRI